MDELLSTILNLAAGAGLAASFTAVAALVRRFRTVTERETDLNRNVLVKEALGDIQVVREKLIEIEEDLRAMGSKEGGAPK